MDYGGHSVTVCSAVGGGIIELSYRNHRGTKKTGLYANFVFTGNCSLPFFNVDLILLTTYWVCFL